MQEQQLAKRLLQIRRDGVKPSAVLIGVTPAHLLRLLFLTLITALFILVIQNPTSPLFMTILVSCGWGICVGAILKEFSFTIRVKSNWPFTEKVTDWGLVQQLAGEIPTAELVDPNST